MPAWPFGALKVYGKKFRRGLFTYVAGGHCTRCILSFYMITFQVKLLIICMYCFW